MGAIDEIPGSLIEQPMAARTRAVVALEVLLAVSAVAGSVGLATGSLSMGETERQLPFHSPVLGGIALAAIVAVPAIVAAVAALRRRPWARSAHLVTGILLMAWIVLETAVIGLSSPLQPIMFAWGAAIIGLGGLPRHARRV
jgi:hypothetical protein